MRVIDMTGLIKRLPLIWLAVAVAFCVALGAPALAQETPETVPAGANADSSATVETGGADATADPRPRTPSHQPVTTLDPVIPLEQLAVLVKPLTKSQLQVEADAWFDLLRSKAQQVAAARLSVSKTNEAIGSEDQQSAQESLAAAEAVKRQADQQAAEVEQQVIGSARQAIEQGSEAAETEDATKDSSTEGAAEVGTEADPGSNAADLPDQADQTDESASQDAGPGADAAVMKNDLLSELPLLKDQRAEISDRLSVVLNSLERKGGDVAEYRLYMAAVSGIELDTTDWSTAWAGITGWAVSKEGGQRWLWNIAKFLIIILVTLILAKLIAAIVNWLLDRKVHLTQLAERLISRMIKDVVILIGFAVALTTLEIDITPIIAAIGATGLVIGLALQGTLSNFASGLMILINRPFDVGDVVTAGGITGLVDQMNLVSTRFRTFDNQTIHVPNNEIWNNVITNITANDTRRVDLEFGIGYDDDFEHAERVIQEIVSKHELVLDDPAPSVVTHALSDSSVNIVCWPWAKTSDWWKVKTDITREVKRRFDAEGITIPYPHRDVYLHNTPVADTKPFPESEDSKLS